MELGLINYESVLGGVPKVWSLENEFYEVLQLLYFDAYSLTRTQVAIVLRRHRCLLVLLKAARFPETLDQICYVQSHLRTLKSRNWASQSHRWAHSKMVGHWKLVNFLNYHNFHFPCSDVPTWLLASLELVYRPFKGRLSQLQSSWHEKMGRIGMLQDHLWQYQKISYISMLSPTNWSQFCLISLRPRPSSYLLPTCRALTSLSLLGKTSTIQNYYYLLNSSPQIKQ